MSFISSFSGDAYDSVQGKNASPADQNVAGALCKFQNDAQPTTLVRQSAEQKPLFNDNSTLVQQAIEQNPSTMASLVFRPRERNLSGGTTFVQQAEQNKDDLVVRNVEGVLSGNFLHFDRIDGTPTNYVQQAVEQNGRGLARPAEQNMGGIVREAAEQNKNDTVIRNVESILIQNFKHFNTADGKETNYVLEAKEQRDKPVQGFNQWYSQDLETNLIDNASHALTRGTAMEMLATPPKEFKVGPVGELQGLDPKDFWHSQNDKTDLSKYLKQNATAVKYNPESVAKAVSALEWRIDQNVKDVKVGKPFDADQTDRMRQMTENAALIKLAVAESQQAKDPKAAKELVSGKGYSVNELIRIAESNGANKDNIQQLKKMVEQFEKR